MNDLSKNRKKNKAARRQRPQMIVRYDYPGRDGVPTIGYMDKNGKFVLSYYPTHDAFIGALRRIDKAAAERYEGQIAERAEAELVDTDHLINPEVDARECV